MSRDISPFNQPADPAARSLPNGWSLWTLAQLGADEKEGINPQEFPEEEFEYYSIPAYQDGQKPVVEFGGRILSQKNVVSGGSVLFGKLNPRVEKVWLVNSSASTLRKIASTEFIPIVPDASRFDARFIYFLCWSRHVMPVAKGLVSGSTPSRQRVDPSAFRQIAVPVPTTLAEQRAIAAVLGKLQAVIAAQQAIIDRTAELKAALLAKLFTEGTRGEALKETAIGLIPESWVLRPCGEVCDQISVGIVIRPAQYYQRDGVPCFRSANIRADKLDESNLVFISEESNAKLSKSILKAGDVLIVRTGYPGTSCVVPTKYAGANCIDIIFARCKTSMNSHFLSRFLNSQMGKRQVIVGNNSAQQHFNVGAVKSLMVPVPLPDEQADIVSMLEVIDSRIDAAQSGQRVYEELFAAMLDELMTGRIRVHDMDLTDLGVSADA